MLHDLLHIEPLAEQFPNSRSGLVEFENTAGRNINENRVLIQPLCDDFRIWAQHKINSKLAQETVSKKASLKIRGRAKSDRQRTDLLGAELNRQSSGS